MTAAAGTGRLDELIAGACDRFAERVALDDGEDVVGYHALGQEVQQAAKALAAAGHLDGEPVLVAADNRSGDLIGQLATWTAGGTAIPVHRSTPPRLLRATARRVGARLLVGDPRHHPAPWEEVAATTGEPWVREVGAASPVPEELNRDQALVIFTSGSTGQPKGVVLSHRALHAKLEAIATVLPFHAGTTAAHVLHLNFSFGQWTSLLTLATGGTLRLVPRFGVERVLTLLAGGPVDRIAVVPSMLRQLATALEEPGAGPAWRDRLGAAGSPATWIAGGEPLTAGLGRRMRALLPGSGIADVFGLSESATSDFILTPGSYDADAGTIGRPSPGVRFRVEPLPDGTAGELWLRTPYLMTGYLGDPAATAATMTGSWLRTGDLVRQRPDGLLELVGRAKQLIVRGGAKISPLEVEAAYATHPDCAGCVAVGVDDEELGQRLHLLFVPRAGTSPGEQQVRDHGRENLDRYKVPERVHFADAVPLGRTGKIDRAAAASLVRDRLTAAERA